MAETLHMVESLPAAYPSVPSGITLGEVDGDVVWQRIEQWVAWRWSERAVVYTVEGPGDWRANLTPVTFSATEVWQDNAWTTVALDPSPLGGYVLPGAGPYRFTGTAGSDDTPPAAVLEAFKRLGEYLASDPGTAGASSATHDVGPVTVSVARNPAWMARAMHNSGAGDLLRPWRMA